MDKVSDRQKLLWLTTIAPTRHRAMANNDGLNGYDIACYAVPLPRRPIVQPSFGNLDKLPPELVGMVLEHLTLGDLEAVSSCSTGARLAVVAFPAFYNLLEYAPEILATLKITQLARSFAVKQIYETFTSFECTNCGQFGGYVFLPSFSRCCLHCAETELKFLPMSRDGARIEFGVTRKKIFDRLPKLNNILGEYSASKGEIKEYSTRRSFFARDQVAQFRKPHHPSTDVRPGQKFAGDTLIRAKERYMCLTPLPRFFPKSNRLEKGVCCAGCDHRALEHGLRCQDVHEDEVVRRCLERQEPKITDGYGATCVRRRPHDQCGLITDQHRRYDAETILTHIQGCQAAQALLKLRYDEAARGDADSDATVSLASDGESDS
ncbi:hypothetical protein MMC07_000971 [Pseudocyphellaria aurata]|nr:hypothetical protein [Pseudocyphellaria aurata]